MLRNHYQLKAPLQVGVSGFYALQVRDRLPQLRLCPGRSVVAQRTTASRAVESSTSDRSMEGERNSGRKINTMRRLVAIFFFLAATASTPIEAAGTLSDAANQLQPGNWVQLSAAANQQTAMQQSGAWLTSQSNDVGYDPVRRIAHYVGKRQNSYPYRHIYYREDKHDWVVGVNVTSNSSGHGYDHNAVDPRTGDVYMRRYGYGVRGVYKASGGNLNSWGSIPNWQDTGGNTQVAIGATWWSGEFTGLTQGGLLIYDSGESDVFIYDPVTSSWETPITDIGQTSTYHSIMSYSAVHNVAVFGGGNDQSRRIWRLNSDRSITAMPNAPFNVGVYTGGGAYVVEDPVTGNFLFVSTQANKMYELDPTGSGSWSLVNVSVPTDIRDGDRGNICWSVPDSGVVVFAGASSSGESPSMYLYKHAPSAPTIRPREPTDLRAD